MVMTRSAARFVGPVTFEAITRRPVITSQWKPGINTRLRAERSDEASTEPWRSRGDIEHIAIADGIALLLVAPCTANVIGKFANGIADDFLTSLYLATRAPVLLAPAMNANMLAHEAVQRNLQVLAALPDPMTLGDKMSGKTCAGTWVTGTGTDGKPREVYLYHVVDNEETFGRDGAQAVVWQTAINPVVAFELLASGAWAGAGVLGPEAFDAVPFLDLLNAYGSPWGMEERS